jgi:protocatechuate 3,4-dioxygenase beta subunit
MRRILTWARILAVSAVAVVTLSACGGGGEILLGYYLYKEFVDKGGNSRIWHGKVSDTNGQPLPGYLVEITANRPDPAGDVRRSDETNENGEYEIVMPWYELATYEISVLHDNITVYHDNIGIVFNQDQPRDIQVSPVATVTVSGTVTDSDSELLPQVFVTVAKPASIGTEPDTLITLAEGGANYQLTNSTGVYYFENIFGEPLLVGAFHPSYGFGYFYIEEPSPINSGGTVTMPGAGQVEIRVRVLDSTGEPLENAILPVDYRFTLKLAPAYDLSSQIALAVADAGLFSNITAEEVIALHPAGSSLQVSSTDAEGFADTTLEAAAGLYRLTLEDTQGGAFVGVLVGLETRVLHDAIDGEIVEVRVPLS